jgi:uncharacterized protein
MTDISNARKYILTFLALTFLSSSIFWLLIRQAGDIAAGNGLLTFGLMWCPGLSAILTTLFYQRNLHGLVRVKPKPRSTLLLGYVLPVVYGTITYGIIWIARLGLFTTKNLPAGQTLGDFIYQAAGVGFFIALGSAIGEELGWRGLLAPQLAKLTTYTKTSAVSGLIHTLWHLPLILFANYHSSTPLWFALPCFTIMVVSLNFVFVWLRLKSGSFLPAAIMHASHNTLIQTLFTTLTSPTAATPYVAGEFGAGLSVVTASMAFIFWKKRGQLEVLHRLSSSNL